MNPPCELDRTCNMPTVLQKRRGCQYYKITVMAWDVDLLHAAVRRRFSLGWRRSRDRHRHSRGRRRILPVSALSADKEIVAAAEERMRFSEWPHMTHRFLRPVTCSIGRCAWSPAEDGISRKQSIVTEMRKARGTVVSKCSGSRSYRNTGDATAGTICGHSLRTLKRHAKLEVSPNTPCRTPTSYTYASPRTGDHIFAASYNAAIPASYRIVNRQDLVLMPPIIPLPYEHVNTKYELVPKQGQINPTIVCMHHLTTYLFLMGQLAGNTSYTLDDGCAPVGPQHDLHKKWSLSCSGPRVLLLRETVASCAR